MKYRDAPFDTVLETGHQFYVVKIEGAQWAQRVRRDGTLLGVTDVAADLEVEVIGKVNVDANSDPEPKRKSKSKPEQPVEPDEPVRLEFDQAARLDT